MCRELSQIEYQHLWPDLHKKPIKFAMFLKDYNAVVPLKKRIPFLETKRGYIPVTIVYRESLPVKLQKKLDLYEATLPVPFVNGGLRLIQGGLR